DAGALEIDRGAKPGDPSPNYDDTEALGDGQLLRGVIPQRRQLFRDDRIVFVEDLLAHSYAQHLEPQFTRGLRNRHWTPRSPRHDRLERCRADLSHSRIGMS